MHIGLLYLLVMKDNKYIVVPFVLYTCFVNNSLKQLWYTVLWSIFFRIPLEPFFLWVWLGSGTGSAQETPFEDGARCRPSPLCQAAAATASENRLLTEFCREFAAVTKLGCSQPELIFKPGFSWYVCDHLWQCDQCWIRWWVFEKGL